MCYETDRMLKRAEHNAREIEQLEARSAKRNQDFRAIGKQITWLSESEKAASTEDDKSQFAKTADYLLALQAEILKEGRLDRPKPPPLPTIGEILYIPVAYALQVLLNVVLYVIFTVIMMAAVFVAVFLFFKTL